MLLPAIVPTEPAPLPAAIEVDLANASDFAKAEKSEAPVVPIRAIFAGSANGALLGQASALPASAATVAAFLAWEAGQGRQGQHDRQALARRSASPQARGASAADRR